MFIRPRTRAGRVKMLATYKIWVIKFHTFPGTDFISIFNPTVKTPCPRPTGPPMVIAHSSHPRIKKVIVIEANNQYIPIIGPIKIHMGRETTQQPIAIPCCRFFI